MIQWWRSANIKNRRCDGSRAPPCMRSSARSAWRYQVRACLAIDPDNQYPKIVEIAGINQRERTPAPKSQSENQENWRSGQLPWEAKSPLLLFFDNRSTYLREMKAGSLLSDDELGALRESASSPSSGEVCLEVCSMQCLSLPSSIF